MNLEQILFQNESIIIETADENVYIKVLKKGYDLQSFNNIIKGFPRVSITLFVALKSALDNGLATGIKIGELRPKIEVNVNSDKLSAYAILRLTEKEYEEHNKKQLVSEIIDAALAQSITFGIDINRIAENMKPMEKFEVARGIEPIPGNDAVITYYEIKKSEPVLFQDGSVNHYELNLINKVDEGQWLGERIEPTEGTPGRNLFNEEVAALNGKQERLKYDRISVKEVYDEKNNVTVLLAKRTGAVVFNNEQISVSNYIEIDGDVCFHTGNIDFDGFVDVKNTVEDNFYVIAENDIQILGAMGVGGADRIESREGNIYIRGGIAGKNKAKIIAKGDVYTKFASDCIIECGGTLNIGYYAMNCTIKAKEVIMESTSSKIIGGEVDAEIRIDVSELGSKAGIPTKISVEGFSRIEMKKEYEDMGTIIENLKEKMETLKKSMSRFKLDDMSNEDRFKMDVLDTEYYETKNRLSKLMNMRKKYTSLLKTKGEGEVKIRKATYPGVQIRIKDDTIFIREQKNLQADYYWNGEKIVEE